MKCKGTDPLKLYLENCCWFDAAGPGPTAGVRNMLVITDLCFWPQGKHRKNVNFCHVNIYIGISRPITFLNLQQSQGQHKLDTVFYIQILGLYYFLHWDKKYAECRKTHTKKTAAENVC